MSLALIECIKLGTEMNIIQRLEKMIGSEISLFIMLFSYRFYLVIDDSGIDPFFQLKKKLRYRTHASPLIESVVLFKSFNKSGVRNKFFKRKMSDLIQVLNNSCYSSFNRIIINNGLTHCQGNI